MRLTTDAFVKMETKGYPAHTFKHGGTIREIILGIGKWLTEVPMGSRIVITIGRTEAEVDNKGSAAQDLTAELESMLGGEEIE